MKKTLLDTLPADLPPSLCRLAAGARIFDSSCSPEARVYYIERDEGYYLKCAACGTLAREAQMTAYFHKKGMGAHVLDYVTDSRDWLLTARVAGEDCTHERYLADPVRLCDTLALALRALHESDHTDCPVQDRTASYLALARENYQKGRFDTSLFSPIIPFPSAEHAYRTLCEGLDALGCDTLLHGDYCLPNIMLNNWHLSGFIDVGNGGVGDRHIDLFWGVWTLHFNLKTTKYKDRFLDAYGRDRADEALLRVVAAAEVFG